jgi:hypothetical protein
MFLLNTLNITTYKISTFYMHIVCRRLLVCWKLIYWIILYCIPDLDSRGPVLKPLEIKKATGLLWVGQECLLSRRVPSTPVGYKTLGSQTSRRFVLMHYVAHQLMEYFPNSSCGKTLSGYHFFCIPSMSMISWLMKNWKYTATISLLIWTTFWMYFCHTPKFLILSCA